jgi:hypothetical protein
MSSCYVILYLVTPGCHVVLGEGGLERGCWEWDMSLFRERGG